mmetsp:Transcript_6030/g.8782  ORF Transcript_6030/g.8782 Transcript_6030/m.8782 type:complete len:144 (-) Transcript_6030:54-485(-)
MLPLFKIGVLAFKHISKLIIKEVKKNAHQNKQFRKMVVSLGNYVAKLEFRWRTGKQAKFQVREDRAIENAAEILGEGILFGTFSLFIIYEYGYKKQVETEEKRVAGVLQQHAEEVQRQLVQYEINDLRSKVELLEAQATLERL